MEELVPVAMDIVDSLSESGTLRCVDWRLDLRWASITGKIEEMSIPMPTRVEEPVDEELYEPDTPWVVIVWNDPINLMSYVTLVLQKLFGYSDEKATKLMLQVHNDGKAAVSSGPREKAELDVFRLHEHGLWATMEKS